MSTEKVLEAGWPHGRLFTPEEEHFGLLAGLVVDLLLLGPGALPVGVAGRAGRWLRRAVQPFAVAGLS